MPGVQSIERAFALLRAVATEPAGVTDLADRTDLPKSTVARLLAALVAEGAVEQSEEGGDYALGGGLLELARSSGPDPSLIAAARPFLTLLTAETGETAGLSVLDGYNVRWLDNVVAEDDVMMRDWTGELTPFNVVASGLVLVAGLPSKEIERYLTSPLADPTEKSITDPAELDRRLAEARHQGAAWTIGEFDEGINSIAAPVSDARGRTVAAINVHGPAYRFPPEGKEQELADLVRSTAEQLSTRMI